MITNTRRFEWDAGHRVLKHEGKCKNLHGHRYVAEVTVTSDELDSLGRVIDFSVLKSIVGGWIDEYWDHNLMLHKADPIATLEKGMQLLIVGRAPYLMNNGNPTAENIAQELSLLAQRLLRTTGIRVCNVTVWETPNCKASY